MTISRVIEHQSVSRKAAMTPREGQDPLLPSRFFAPSRLGVFASGYMDG
jgi:hypothetical protein